MTGGERDSDTSLSAAIRESDDFERCESCGRTVVQLSTHQCPTGDRPRRNNRETRERRAERDERAEEDLVGVYHRTKGNTYAYHELDADRRPRCPTRNPTKSRKFEVMTRREAKARGKAPCGHCRDGGTPGSED